MPRTHLKLYPWSTAPVVGCAGTVGIERDYKCAYASKWLNIERARNRYMNI
jgi:hypothetical protein